MTQQTATSGNKLLRTGLILVIVLLAFVASYRMAVAVSADAPASGQESAAVGTQGAASQNSGSPACACCGGGGTGERIEDSATIGADGVQRITVDTSNGYNPSAINLAAGIPAEITFKQASGCLGQVTSAELGFFEDLTSGDKTVKLAGLTPGTYGFSCGMQMVFGEIIVK